MVTCPRARCGGLLILDRAADDEDEYVCQTCGHRLYGTQPDTHGTKASPLWCPECGGRVWGEWNSRHSVACSDCLYVLKTLLFLDTTGIPDRYGRAL